ncbi:CYTH domain-containing protein [Methylobacterium nodulans]|uniref:Adenylate cyclase n=1 Tax=Methylobacterium nodulans (strain LMG 21967 / CNCM I-2342 / ORS 2060) TaxID=460265 RepID=B8IEN8_METNO|nr:CYTH domain-containing protein [Methylobacterium nodulans]ACL61381.1 adenylate cyclase [Methylobacterium nodulans ORS 2060]
MRYEVERKFLVAHDGWLTAATGRRRLRDGLISQSNGGKVRVRLDETRAWLTVKGPRQGLGRCEFEYEIPPADAEAMMATICEGNLIEKIRYGVPHAGRLWEVDVFQGDLVGLILAEVELERADAPLVLPDWAGPEVSGDPRFRQSTLLRLRAETGRALTLDAVLGLAAEACPVRPLRARRAGGPSAA